MVRNILFLSLYLFLICGKSNPCFAAEEVLDYNLDSLYLSDNLATLKDEAYSFIARGKYAECEKASEKLLLYSIRENDNWSRTYALIYLGQARVMLGKFEKAYNHLSEAEELAKKHNNDSALCSVYNGLGLYEYNVNSDEARALNFYLQGVRLADKCGHKLLYSILSANAALLLTIKNDENSYQYARECYRIGYENKDSYLIYCGAMSIARYLYMNKKTDEALKYLKESERLSVQNDFNNKSDIYNSYGEIALEEGNYVSACDFFEAAIQEHGFSQTSYVVLTYLGYGRALFNLENYKEAIEKLQQGLTISLEARTPIYLRELYLLLSENYEKLGETNLALEFYKKYVTQQVSLYNKDNEKTYRELMVKYETEKKENELIRKDILLREQKQRVIFLWSLVLLILCISIWGYISYYRKNKLYNRIVLQSIEWIKKEKTLVSLILELKNKIKLLDHPEGSKYISSSLGKDEQAALFEKLESLMQEEKIYKNHLMTREKVAELLSTNRTYLSQTINEITGDTFKSYINKYRIEEACRVLADVNNTIPLKALSYQLGFNSLTTFYTLFKAAVQMSPDQYRKHAYQISMRKRIKIKEE